MRDPHKRASLLPFKAEKYETLVVLTILGLVLIFLGIGLTKEKPVNKPTPQATTYEKICMDGVEILQITNSKRLHFVSTGRTCLEDK